MTVPLKPIKTNVFVVGVRWVLISKHYIHFIDRHYMLAYLPSLTVE